jgi:penicillin V acylase-like amidase (Ntn superfamily)
MSVMLILVGFKCSSCTTFCIKDARNLVLGKNFDFYTGVGHVVVNKRNIRKASFTPFSERSFEWVSKYGSVTFNQMGREFPCGGINEKGLVIELLWLSETGYPSLDERHGMFESQWIQYQLDNATSVKDVLASDNVVRISKAGSAPVHFLICDAGGNIATLEYLGGKMIFHTGSTLPICALTNDTYAKSENFVNSITDLKRKYSAPSSSGSLDRFGRTAMMLHEFSNQNAIDYSFNILNAVSQPELTQWSIVYDIKNMTVHYKTRDNPETRTMKLADFDFACNSPSLYSDIGNTMVNNHLPFQPYSYERNREIIYNALDALSTLPEFKPLLPSEKEKESMTHYPASTECATN